MLSPLRNRFGIPGVISVIALVFAMLGGAYAASNSSEGGKATASAKAKKGPRGPKGATGPVGPAGPAGPQGPAGANGKDGSSGADGKAGTNGTNGAAGAPGAAGKSVAMTEILAGGPECHEDGGAELEVESSGSPVQICNGEEGPAGPKGDPWTAGGTLPAAATETGTWAFNANRQTITVDVGGESKEITVGATEAWAPMSFPIPLIGGMNSSSGRFHFQGEATFEDFDGAGEKTVGCKGGVTSPAAPVGHLCVYTSVVTNATLLGMRQPGNGGGGIGRSGGFLRFQVTGPDARGSGSFAVTGCTELPEGDPNKCP
jgi:hypothetical protein